MIASDRDDDDGDGDGDGDDGIVHIQSQQVVVRKNRLAVAMVVGKDRLAAVAVVVADIRNQKTA